MKYVKMLGLAAVAATALMAFVGAGATVHVEANIPRLTTNSLCAGEALWKGTYEVTSPPPLYFAAHT